MFERPAGYEYKTEKKACANEGVRIAALQDCANDRGRTAAGCARGYGLEAINGYGEACDGLATLIRLSRHP